MTKYESLLAALEKAGSQEALAAICDVTQPAVSKWVTSTKELPVIYCRTVERATGIPAHKLQPSHFDPPQTFPDELSNEEVGEYGNRTPVLDKYLERA